MNKKEEIKPEKFNWSYLSKNKSTNLNSLVLKIEFDLNTKKISPSTEYLQEQCFLIEECILDTIVYAKTKKLEEKSIRALIWNINKALEIQKVLENILAKQGEVRDIKNEYERFAAFDFKLDGEEDEPYLYNATEIEERIITETGFGKRVSKINKDLVIKAPPEFSFINNFDSIKEDIVYK